MTLCDTFKRLALETWDSILNSRKVNYQLKEETLTDKNMLDLKLRHSNQIITKVYTKHQEGKNGADWEWWFKGNSNRWIGFRVQAKIINNHSKRFEHLHYQNRKSKIYQSDRLINDALSQHIPRVPLYCYFLQTNDQNRLNNWPCGTFGQTKDFFGCSLSSAFTVQKLRANFKDHLSDLEKFLKPWHCLVCCNGHGNGEFISNINDYAMANFDFRNEESSETELSIPENFITDNPPEYVMGMLDNPNNDNIKNPDENLYGVVIIKESAEK